MMAAFHQASIAFGLSVSVPKTEVMAPIDTSTLVYIDGKLLNQVEWFKYLGAKQTSDGKSKLEVQRRIGLAWAAFSRYLNWFVCKKLSYKHKIALYHTYVLTVLLYGCETWTTTAQMLTDLESFNYSCLLFICGHFRIDQVSYATLLKRTKMDVTIEGLVRQRRLNWVGRIQEMPWSRLPKRVLYGMLMEKNNIKGSVSSFKLCVKQDLLKFGLLNNGLNEDINLEHWSSMTSPFGEWNKLVSERRSSTFMRDFYVQEEKKHNDRALRKETDQTDMSNLFPL
jgi:hypothetical protein